MNQRFKNGLNCKIEQEKQQRSYKNQKHQETSTPSKTSYPPLKTSTPLFNYPPLPKWEIRLCWLVTFGTVAYAWFCVWLASSKWEFKIGKSQASISNLPFFGIKIKDESNWEWFRWSPFATSQYLPLLVGHSILFNFLPVFFPEKIWNKIYLFASMAGSAWVFTPRLLFASLLQGFFILGFTLYFRRTFIVWLSALPILYVVMNYTDWIHNDVFLVLLFISYTLLSYISFCLELVKQQGKSEIQGEKPEEKSEHQQNIQENKQQNRPEQEEKHEKHGEKQPKMPEKQPNKRQFPPAKQQEKYQNNQQNIQKQPEKHLLNNSKHPIYLLERMLFYTFYQPFLFSLIVLYPEFERQYAYRNAKQRDWIIIISKCFRVAFWWAICELCLHFVYFGSIALDTEFMQKLPKDQFVSIGMAIGAFFHLKYVVIFGLPAIFALIDGMEPPDGPICISRVSLYSKIWRGFDRGLYAFFKEYIFIPICWPSFSLPRKLIGLCISFTFVLLWHGFYHHNIVWIGLNIVELSIEFTSKAIYSIPKVQNIRKQILSDLNFRRLLGWLQIVPFAFGLYSNFYFLGGSAVGWLFVQRIFWEETIPFRWPFILLITCGYFYTQIAMEIERCWPEKRKVCVFQGIKNASFGEETKKFLKFF